MIIRKTCRYIAESVLRNIEEKEDNLDVDSLERRLSLIVIAILTIFSSVIIGLSFDVLIPILYSFTALVVIRYISGGNHFDSPDMCYLVTTSAIVINPVLQYELNGLDNYFFIISLIGYLIFSPYNESDNKKNLIKKAILVIFLIFSYSFNSNMLYTFIILLPDAMIRNPLWKKWSV